MSKVTVSRLEVTAEEVSAVLRDALGPRYTVKASVLCTGFRKEVPGDANTLLVEGGWFERANIRIVANAGSTDIDVTPGATYFGLIRLIDRIGLARRVLRILEHAPELAGPSKK